MQTSPSRKIAMRRPLFMHFAPIEERELSENSGFRYDPILQETVVTRYAGGNDTVSYQATSGTEPKNEADAYMDDES